MIKSIVMKAKVARNILLKKPIMVLFNVTNKCNERCKMCNIWKESSNPMSLDEIRVIAHDFAKFGIGYVYLQGGEPLLRKDIIDIVDIFLKEGIHPMIITNGILLTPELAKQIAVRHCNIAISIDSMEKEKYAELRGTNADTLLKVKKNIKMCCEAVSSHKGNWAITTTITNESSKKDIKHIESFAKKYGFMHAIRPYVFVSGVAGKKDENLEYHSDEVLEIFKEAYKKAKKQNYLASLVYLEHIKYIKKEKLSQCDAMKYSMVMKETGELFPCLELPHCEFNLKSFYDANKKYHGLICKCSKETPCYWNCARTIGVLVRNKWKILLHFPEIILQMKKYGNYF